MHQPSWAGLEDCWLFWRVGRGRAFCGDGAAYQCPLSRVNRTSQCHAAMSANDPKRTLASRCRVSGREAEYANTKGKGRLKAVPLMARGPW